ncbi:MAG: non-hydrolyzing UDP-N-acetylglucosamine 2-epimerase [Erysipelotrichaceae bacterium]
MKKVMVVFGTRPEAIKMCPVVKELRNRAQLECVVCVSGQHREMLDQVIEAFGVSVDYDLSIMKPSQSLMDVTTNILQGMECVLTAEKPDLVLVHGDTTTTFTVALACFYMHIPVGHVEAGLRTYDLTSPYPEEFNRQAVSIVAQLHFAPTQNAYEHLISEGKKPSSIYITGNTAIDALQTTVRDTYTHPILDWAKQGRMVLLTAHRRENVGEPLHHMFKAIARIVEEYEDVRVVYPVHKNPLVRTIADQYFKNQERVLLMEPLDVLDFHNFLANAYFVLTDSGGIQEEAPSLGKPVLVMRDTTERPEGVEAGVLKLVGTHETNIYQHCKQLLENKGFYESMSKASNPYGDGLASRRIVDILETHWSSFVK